MNGQAQWLLDKKLITPKLANTIDKECGDNDPGLFLGHLLATGRIGANVVHEYMLINRTFGIEPLYSINDTQEF